MAGRGCQQHTYIKDYCLIFGKEDFFLNEGCPKSFVVMVISNNISESEYSHNVCRDAVTSYILAIAWLARLTTWSGSQDKKFCTE